MESKIKETTTFTLVLNQAEAVWLKALVQNPIRDIPLNEENKFDRQMREAFWNALTS